MKDHPSPPKPAARIRLVVWLLGISLSTSSVFGALSLRNASFFDASSYLSYLPSLYFIALNTAFIALAEAFGFAFLTRREIAETQVLKLLSIFVSLLVFVFIAFISYSKSVINIAASGSGASWTEIFFAFSYIIVAVCIVGGMKTSLDKMMD